MQNLDKNHDGYLSKTEFNKLLKNLTKDQVKLFKMDWEVLKLFKDNNNTSFIKSCAMLYVNEILLYRLLLLKML